MDEAQHAAALTAIAQERSRSRRTGIYEVEAGNQHGERIVRLRGSSHQSGGAVIEHATFYSGASG